MSTQIYIIIPLVLFYSFFYFLICFIFYPIYIYDFLFLYPFLNLGLSFTCYLPLLVFLIMSFTSFPLLIYFFLPFIFYFFPFLQRLFFLFPLSLFILKLPPIHFYSFVFFCLHSLLISLPFNYVTFLPHFCPYLYPSPLLYFPFCYLTSFSPFPLLSVSLHLFLSPPLPSSLSLKLCHSSYQTRRGTSSHS